MRLHLLETCVGDSLSVVPGRAIVDADDHPN